MDTFQKLSELERRRFKIENSISSEDHKKVLENKLTARQRIASLLDQLSFVEIGAFVTSRENKIATPADGVVCGYGTVDGQLVYVYSQDSSVLNGAIGEMHAKKIVKIYDEAIKVGVPVIGFIETVGLRLKESIDALQGYGEIFAKMSEASGYIPQICVICGDCAGGGSFIAGLSDFVFLSTEHAKMYLNSPNTMNDVEATFDHVAAPYVHLKESGLATMGAEREEELINRVKTLLSYLPSNSKQDVPCYTCHDHLNRMEESFNTIDFSKIGTRDVIKQIADDYSYLELWEEYGVDATVGFIRLNGATVGIIGNQVDKMDYFSVTKVIQFINYCNAFNIGILTFTNIKQLESNVMTEKLGMIKQVSKLIHAFVNATVPKVNVILNNAHGMSYITMNSKHIGADYVYAWPTADMKTLDSEMAVKVMYHRELQQVENPLEYMKQKITEYEEQNSVYGMAARGYIDDIIEPAATRKRVIVAFENLINKDRHFTKKHSTLSR